MVGLKRCFIAAGLLALATVSILAHHVVADQVHHKVGDEGGWDPSGRIFKVGDIIWLTYGSEAKEGVVELQSLGEFLDCDLTNPIRMYTEGLDKVSLDGQGSRYFASGNLESCKKGLKIHVNVQPPPKPTPQPTPPSDPSPPDEPNVPEPDVPEPDVPHPDVPEPDVPQPDVPEPVEPNPPDEPEPEPDKPDVPPPDEPNPPDEPEPEPDKPDVPPSDEPNPPDEPEPEPDEPDIPPPSPSSSTHLGGGVSFVVIVSALVYSFNF